MRIINLVENTEGSSGCGYEHGLSFYIETEKHKLLVDTGASDLFIKNAEKLGVELTKVDTVVLSHGHYDHGGGILPFVKINPTAKIYIQESAFEEYYSLRDNGPRYIGLAEGIRELPQVVIVREETASNFEEAGTAQEPTEATASAESDEEQEPAEATQIPVETTKQETAEDTADEGPATENKGIFRIDDELSLFSGIGNAHRIPPANRNLRMKAKSGLVQDDFRHEQCLVISDEGKKILLSGCAHHGILNILDRFRELYGGEPDVVISGFHMMKKTGYSVEDIDVIINTALTLWKYKTVFYTGHCTGEEPFSAMKKIMGGNLFYVHSGDEIGKQTEPESGEQDTSKKAVEATSDSNNAHDTPGNAAEPTQGAGSAQDTSETGAAETTPGAGSAQDTPETEAVQGASNTQDMLENATETASASEEAASIAEAVMFVAEG